MSLDVTQENLSRARTEYRAATQAYWVQRDLGGIVPLDRSIKEEEEDYRAGKRFKTVSPEAAKIMGRWQLAKSELDHWAALAKKEAGFPGCPICEIPEPGIVAADRRLPPERDEVSA